MSTSMVAYVRAALLSSSLGLLLAAGATQAQPPSAEAAEVIAVAKAQWAGEDGHKSAAQAHASLADDYTEFNADVPTLLEGKAVAGRFYEASLQGGDKSLASEMVNPHVQLYGDAAILTYNFAGMVKDGEGKLQSNFAKSTRVYVRQGGEWKLVHANFAPVVSAP